MCLYLASISVSDGEGLVCKHVHGHAQTAFVSRSLSVCWCCPLTTPSSLSLFPATTMKQAATGLAQSGGPNSGGQTAGEQSCGKRSVYRGGQKGEQGPAVHLAAKGGQQNLDWVNRYRASRPREVIIPFSSELFRPQFFDFLSSFTHLKPLNSLPRGTTGMPVFLRIPLPLPLLATPPWISPTSSHSKHSRSLQESKTSQNHLGTPKPPGPPTVLYPPHHQPPQILAPPGLYSLRIPLSPETHTRTLVPNEHRHTEPQCPAPPTQNTQVTGLLLSSCSL